MVKNVIAGLILLGIGYFIGVRVQTKELQGYEANLIRIRSRVKEENNRMVSNFADLYAMTKPDPSKFTDIDELLSSMWMD